MSPEEIEMSNLISEHRKVFCDFTSRIVEARTRLLSAGCSHPTVEPYKWEWDNGYGVQKNITGERCVLCDTHSAYGPFRKVK